MRCLSIVVLLLSYIGTYGQQAQRIKGTITDRDSKQPLIGATIQVLSIVTANGTSTDLDGNYILDNIPPGRHVLEITYLGYDPVSIPNILVTSGKEVILDIEMQESLINLNEVVITAETDKDRAINEMSTVSARTFSLEEVNRYSGGRNDVSRLVTNFAGVSASNDSRNDIVVRGNSPAGILWRMEGVPIPNPNHFSTLGTTGGPVSALNTNLLTNSDFLTSAFPSEYGNAISGVFDVGLRTGNKDKFEFTAQLAAFSGLEAMAEGPIGQTGGSFVASYRYSFVQLASSLNLDFGTNATPNYQDLTFNIDLAPTKLGKFSIYGIGGQSDIEFLAAEVDENDLFAASDADSRATSKFGVLGLKHAKIINQKSYIKSTLAISGTANTFDEYRYNSELKLDRYAFTNVDDQVGRLSLHSYYNIKHNAKLTTKYGVTVDMQQLNSKVNSRDNNPDNDGDGIPDFVAIRDIDGNIGTVQPYATAKYRISPRLTLVGGVHGQIQTLNPKYFVEPRLGLTYATSDQSNINVGYGLHSQIQPLPVFFILSPDNNGNFVTSNDDLGFTKSHHFVLGWDYRMAPNWRTKIETYYQHIFDVPVEATPSSFSMLNAGADFVFPQKSNLVNEGIGRNYGVELTVEKFFSSGYYGLLTGTLFQSKYKGSDGIERNTAFNNEAVINVLGGKEWELNKLITLTSDVKLTAAGGRYVTPVNLPASMLFGTEITFDEQAFSEKLDPYFRLDFKVGFRVNGRKISQQFFMDFQNLTNHQNVFTKRYNRQTNEVNTVYQNGFFPDILWRIQF